MKPASQQSLALLVASVVLASQSWSASFVLNPSFEIDYNETWPHYGTVSDWVHLGGTGTNRAAGPFHNVGTPIPDRLQVFLQQGPGKLSQTIVGLEAGQTYWIQFLYDARVGLGKIDLSVNWDDVELDKIVNVPVSTGGAPYKFRNVPFTATADTGVLSFSTVVSGDATVLLDGVTIVPGGADLVVVANPSFEASGTPASPGYLTAGAGWSGGGDGTIGINAADGDFANNGTIPDQDHVVFIEGASFIQQTLRGLVIGETYNVSFKYNAPTGHTPSLKLTVGETVEFEQPVTPVGAAAPYTNGSATFVAETNSVVIRFEQSGEGGQTVLLDDVRVSGVAVEPIPNLKVGPPRLELGPGQQGLVSLTVSQRRLAASAASVVVRIPNEGVARLVDADVNGQVTLVFPQGAAETTLTTMVEGVGRGATTLTIVDNGGHDGVDGVAAIAGVTSFVVNPSFEASLPGPDPGYGPIAAWTGGSGVNAAGQPFVDNGVIPDRDQAAFMQGASTLSQAVSGLTAGQRYALQLFYNVRNCCDGGLMTMVARIDGTEVANIPDIVAVGAGAPYYFLNLPFTPAGSEAVLEIATTVSGDATLLLDGISIVPQAADELVVKNPSFEASGVPVEAGYQNALAGWSFTGGHGVNVDTLGPFADNGVAGAQDRVAFIQGPSSLSQIIEGLTPGASYTLDYLVNARNGDTAGGTPYKVLIDGVEVLNTVQEPVGVGTPYAEVSLPFTAATETTEIRFEGLAAGTVTDDQSLLLDHVRVRPAGGGGGAITVPLTITLVAGNAVNIAWPVASPAGLVLRASTTLLPNSWAPVATVPFINEGSYNVLEAIDGPVKYYRLVMP